MRKADGDDGAWVVMTRRGLQILQPKHFQPGRSEDVPGSVKLLLVLLMNATLVLLALTPFFGGLLDPVLAPVVSLVPLAAILWLLLTLILCYWLSRPLHNPRALIPAISEMGVAPPARSVYKFGFGVTGLLFVATIRLYDVVLVRKLVSPTLPTQDMASRSIAWGYFAAAGVIIQGVFNLDPRVSPQSLLHFLGAAAFIVGSIFHLQASNTIFTPYAAHLPRILQTSLRAQRVEALRRLFSDHAPVALCFGALAQQAISLMSTRPGFDGGGKGDDDSSGLDAFFGMMGLTQWAMVLLYALLFASYAVELNLMAPILLEA